ncbi:type II toxin-antitoxin system Phd/YefM family antitoxin [Thioalkalivibrio sp. AKL10]|uniref:type II toxin-antitoxin system Phd/YefM family antitoxin n=1 Tax=Thioalkalivibrio sp. AKL10 TaxID=1158158 RepID=UPI0009D982A4|nr:type II toxin-antitoxin system prevent-host-death family antitoxin [Thioalkalivibrio sp. AKL10]
MKELNVREMRASIGHLDEIVQASGEITITRHGKPIARVLPVRRGRQRPDHHELRQRTGPLVPSEILLREERDERG